MTVSLNDAAVAADILQKVAQTIAFCIGGWWVYMNYVRGRTHVPRLQLELDASVKQKDGRFYLLATIAVKNPGLTISEQRIIPLPDRQGDILSLRLRLVAHGRSWSTTKVVAVGPFSPS